MKKIKIMSILLVIATACMLFSGCIANVSDAKLNADGSGTVTRFTGFTKEIVEMMAEADDGASNIQDLKSFVRNGITYYGEYETVNFKTVDEFNKFMNESDESDEASVDDGAFELIKNSDGSFTLKLTATVETGDTSEIEEQASMSDLSEEEIEALMSQMCFFFEMEFPSNIYQVEGRSEGVKIDGNKLSINILEMSKYITEDTTYLFSTNKNYTEPGINLITFVDVPSDFWGYDAIMALSNGGLVNGVGNWRFAPNEDITYAQFCQITARALGFEVGADESGYWAAKAIKSCLDKKLIFDRGEINSKNYDVAMTREAAVSAMYLIVKDNGNMNVKFTAKDIPDYDKISDKYRDNILKAYNLGITSGVDANHTFSPLSNLTRAQVCQLFYNLNITSVPK